VRVIDRFVKGVDVFTKLIAVVLIALLAIVVAEATAKTAMELVRVTFGQGLDDLDVNRLLDVFSVFLIVLLGLEIIETIVPVAEGRPLNVEIVLVAAFIAVARKIIVIDYKSTPGEVLLGIAGLVLALGVSYYLIDMTRHRGRPDAASNQGLVARTKTLLHERGTTDAVTGESLDPGAGTAREADSEVPPVS